jgi:hypothetical protein
MLAALGIEPAHRPLLISELRARRPLDPETETAVLTDAGSRFRTERDPSPAAAEAALFAGRDALFAEAAPRLGVSPRGRPGPTGRRRAGDLVHLWLNRILRGGTPADEAIVLEWLARIYRSRLARAGR